MKRWLLLLVCALAAGLLAFYLTHRLSAPRDIVMHDEIAWLTTEFKLTPAQAAAIEQLHDDYHPVCMEHCRAIAAARKSLAAATDVTRPAAQAELARVERVCHDATLAHLQRVAAQMSPEQRARFLALVTPKLAGHSHHAPLGLK